MKILRRILKLFIARRRQRENAAEPIELTLPGLIIEGVEAIVAEGIPTGAVRFCAPGHPKNPTERNILICDLDTYVSLAARPDSQRLVAFMVHDALRALRLKEQAAERRARRNARRAVISPTSYGNDEEAQPPA